MNMRMTAAAIALAATPFFVTAAAQHADHHPAEATEQSAAMGDGMHQGTGHQMMQLITQVRNGLAALANERDLAVIHKKVAENAKLLEKFQGHMSGVMMQGDMMANCAGAGEQPKK